MIKLIGQTALTFAIGVVAFSTLLILPAWDLGYWQAWVFMAVFLASTSVIGLYLSLEDPALLERRKKFGPAAETNPAQRIIMTLTIIGCAVVLVFCALDHRFGWSPTPWFVSVIGNALVALGLLVQLVVFRENTYGGSTVEIFDDQQVITTGLYAQVRHPMYVSVLVMSVGIPLALGSWWGLALITFMVPVLVWRILDEERLLESDLPGYREYTDQVRFRLVPHLW
ncbi:methyltransferase family protein [Nocardia australiensis]|uniref:methyltransferase family protein n=1 Tax=Nocardia australiensis TaxID=2887191 RepID=UPI001D14D6BB|nr:isoprenylcysteine carboxylmethyltransferase family protein [Nocardia australiensis]